MTRPDISHEQLKQTLSYDPATGIFTWIKSGRIAGWKNLGYVRIRIQGRIYKRARLAWFYVHGEWPKGMIDHISHDKGDDRIVNLRAVDSLNNHRNVSRSIKNRSGVVGVRFSSRRQVWVAQITVRKKNIHLGHYDSIEAATMARKSAESRIGFHANHGAAPITERKLQDSQP